MRRPAARRSFAAEFRKYLKKSRGWPAKKVIEAWARTAYGSVWESGTYSDARNGRPIAEEHILKFVEFGQLADKSDNYARGIQQIWNQYIQEKSGKSLSIISNHEALRHLCDSPRSSSALTMSRQFMLGGPRLLADFVTLTTRPRRFFEICPSDDIEVAIRWVYIESARRSIRSDLPINEAIKAAEHRMGSPIEKYIRHAREWHKVQGATILFAIEKRIRVGVCIALPVTDTTYAAIRSGVMSSSECRTQHLLPRSPFLIVEAFAMRPGELQTSISDPTRCMFIAIVCQQAHLSDVPGIASEVPFHLLAPGGTPENCERLLAYHYKKTNTKLAGTGLDLYERRFFLPEGKRFDYAIAVQWWGLQRLLRNRDPS